MPGSSSEAPGSSSSASISSASTSSASTSSPTTTPTSTTPPSLQDLKDSIPISTVISHYFPNTPLLPIYPPSPPHLYKGTLLWPFHTDNNPSLTFDDSKSLYKCWSCGEGGDMFAFVTNIESNVEGNNVTFKQAINIVMDIAGDNHTRLTLTPPKTTPQAQISTSSQKLKLQTILTLAQSHYTASLLSPTTNLSSLPRHHLAARSIAPTTIHEFGLGWSLPGTHVVDYVRERYDGLVSDADFVEAGIAVWKQPADATPTNRPASSPPEQTPPTPVPPPAPPSIVGKHKHRLTIPIYTNKTLIGFAGRYLQPPLYTHTTYSPPKYLNSPTSLLFNKRQTIYTPPTLQYDTCDDVVVVEGYFDVIALAGIGYTNVVATMGTSVSLEQWEEVCKYAKEATPNAPSEQARIVVAMDNDDAGNIAVARFFNLHLHLLDEKYPAVRVVVAKMPAKIKDCGEFVEKQSKKSKENACIAFEEQVLDGAWSVEEFYVDYVMRQLNATSMDQVLESVLTQVVEFVARYKHREVKWRVDCGRRFVGALCGRFGEEIEYGVRVQIEEGVVERIRNPKRSLETKPKRQMYRRANINNSNNGNNGNSGNSGNNGSNRSIDSTTADARATPSPRAITKHPTLAGFSDLAPPSPLGLAAETSDLTYSESRLFKSVFFRDSVSTPVVVDNTALLGMSEDKLLRVLVKSTFARGSMKAAIASTVGSSRSIVEWSREDKRWLFNCLVGGEGVTPLPVVVEEGMVGQILGFLRDERGGWEDGWFVGGRQEAERQQGGERGQQEDAVVESVVEVEEMTPKGERQQEQEQEQQEDVIVESIVEVVEMTPPPLPNGTLDKYFQRDAAEEDDAEEDAELDRKTAGLIIQETLAVLLRSGAIARRQFMVAEYSDAMKSGDKSNIEAVAEELEDALRAVTELDNSYVRPPTHATPLAQDLGGNVNKGGTLCELRGSERPPHTHCCRSAGCFCWSLHEQRCGCVRARASVCNVNVAASESSHLAEHMHRRRARPPISLLALALPSTLARMSHLLARHSLDSLSPPLPSQLQEDSCSSVGVLHWGEHKGVCHEQGRGGGDHEGK